MLINGWAAERFLIRRVGPIVQYRVSQIDGSGASSQDALPLPSGYYITRMSWTVDGSEGRVRFSTNNSGTLTIPVGTRLTDSYYETTGVTIAPTGLPTIFPGVAG